MDFGYLRCLSRFSEEFVALHGPTLLLQPHSVTDLINRIVQVLRGDLYWVRISARDAELMEPVEP